MKCKKCLNKDSSRREWCHSCYCFLLRKGLIQKLFKKILPSHFTDTQQNYILGSMLGDGCIYRNKPTHMPYFVVNRNRIDKNYLLWESKILGDFVCKTFDKDTFDKRTNKIYHSSSFRTHRCKLLVDHYELWYPNDIKQLPVKLELNPFSLAIWFADDGHIRPTCSPWRMRLKLSTHGFKIDEVERLTHLLSIRYKEKFIIAIDEQKYYIDSSDAGTRAFCNEIDNYLPNSMNRKAYWRKPEACFYENIPGKNKRISRAKLKKP